MGRLSNLLCALLLAAPAGCAQKPSVHISRPYAGQPAGSYQRDRIEYTVSNYHTFPHNFALYDFDGDKFIDYATYSKEGYTYSVTWSDYRSAMKYLIESTLEIRSDLRSQINEGEPPKPSEEDGIRNESK